MQEAWYCPSCRAPLPDGTATARCPECAADFGPIAAWGPVTNNKGKWTPRIDPAAEERDKRSIAYGVAALIGRGVIVFFGWVAVLALAFLSAGPYGGGSRGLLQLTQIVPIAGAVWAALPLLRAVYYRITDVTKSREGKG